MQVYSKVEAQALAESLSLSLALATRLYTARLMGADPSLVLHGGGNVSYKETVTNLFGEQATLMWVKASGQDLADLSLEGLAGLWLAGLEPLASLVEMSDATMKRELLRQAQNPAGPVPSIEALVHAWIPFPYVDHSHADAFLTLSSQAQGREAVAQAYGQEVEILEYCPAGFALAKAVRELFETGKTRGKRGLALMGHGLFTWGKTAQEAYETMKDLAQKATEALQPFCSPFPPAQVEEKQALARWRELAPWLRAELYRQGGLKFLAQAMTDPATLALLEQPQASDYLISSPLTPDHVIRAKRKPLWLNAPPWEDATGLQTAFAQALRDYAQAETAYRQELAPGQDFAGDPFPRMLLLPGLGAVALGLEAKSLRITRDILSQTLKAKACLLQMRTPFVGLEESELFHMEFRPLQQAKLKAPRPPLEGRVGVISGAAGAIGSGIAQELLHLGMQLVVTDLPGERLTQFSQELAEEYGERVWGLPMDVTDPQSVQELIHQVIARFGAIDLLVINQGLAHVSTLSEMDLDRFQLLERVNVGGTLNLLKAFGQLLTDQGTGGDVVLVSTKNVFSPSPSFGAYSATKAGAHQLARIASLELAPFDIRVNMVSPDGVFSDAGKMKSGLWALVGPDRMKARGLDEKGLEEYYQNRNLLKVPVSARDVGRAVAYFATRQSPTTGATLPVDGGLPDATPR